MHGMLPAISYINFKYFMVRFQIKQRTKSIKLKSKNIIGTLIRTAGLHTGSPECNSQICLIVG